MNLGIVNVVQSSQELTSHSHLPGTVCKPSGFRVGGGWWGCTAAAAHQVELSHALNHCLVGLLISGEMEGGILLCELDQPVAHLLQICLTLGLDGNLDDRVWELQHLGFHFSKIDSR